MTIFDDIRADAAAGTPGPWRYSPWHIEEGPDGVYAPDDWLLCATASREDARRIARVPNLERLALAAEVMAEALHKIANEPAKDADAEIIRVDRLACDALTAWKEAQ